jgi:adenylate cyclase
MSDQPPIGTRKLTTILSADVYGYSRLMGSNEDETFKRLTECREIIFNTLRTQRGRVANTAGDAVLADFATAREAVTAAVEIQNALFKLNESVPEDRQMFFRIGINLGEVIERGGDLFGDGVNIAARIQSIAEPGGVCVSSVVYEQVRRNPGFEFEYLGEQVLKNIAEPIKIYRVLTGLRMGVKGAMEGAAPMRTAQSGRPQEQVDIEERSLYLVAVLPFDNLSEDPNQSYFSDGLVEDLTTGLATIPSIRVPARNTMFTYKGKAINVPQLATDLGATHVVEGSVRKSGNTIRINVQLIDAKSGHHIWAKRFDSGNYSAGIPDKC